MRFVPLRVSHPSPVRRLASSGGGGGGGGPVPFPPCLALDRVPPRGRACASGVVRRRGAVVGGRFVCRPPSGAWLGGPGVRGAGGRSALVRPSASLGPALKRASSASLSPWRVWFPYCSGSCPCAAARMRSAGCPCAPARDCRPVEVTVGVAG